ncbi:MAG: DUF1772 domain-containing protein [Pseudolysinimonas sp.]
MMILEIVSVVLAGLLAGIEFIVRWGVQPALSALEDRPHLAARQSLIKRLRILVPAIGLPAAILAIVAAIVGTSSDGSLLRWLGAGFLVVFFGIAFGGTVPINIKVDAWSLDAPPADWKDVIRRWQAIDVFRSTAALVAFVLLVVALTQ